MNYRTILKTRWYTS